MMTYLIDIEKKNVLFFPEEGGKIFMKMSFNEVYEMVKKMEGTFLKESSQRNGDGINVDKV